MSEGNSTERARDRRGCCCLATAVAAAAAAEAMFRGDTLLGLVAYQTEEGLQWFRAGVMTVTGPLSEEISRPSLLIGLSFLSKRKKKWAELTESTIGFPPPIQLGTGVNFHPIIFYFYILYFTIF